MTDQELAARARAGDQDAFERLVLDNQNKVYSLAVRLVGRPGGGGRPGPGGLPEGLADLPSFQGESSFSTWLYRLTTNLCIDWLRRQKRRQETAPASPLDDEEAGWAEPADWEQDPHRKLEQSERGRALARGLERLPEYQRRPLVLRELSGAELSGDRPGPGSGPGDGEVPHRPGPAGPAKILLEDGNFS